MAGISAGAAIRFCDSLGKKCSLGTARTTTIPAMSCRWIVSGEAESNGRFCQSLNALFASPTNHPRKLSEKVPEKARQNSWAWAFAACKLDTLGMLPVVPRDKRMGRAAGVQSRQGGAAVAAGGIDAAKRHGLAKSEHVKFSPHDA